MKVESAKFWLWDDKDSTSLLGIREDETGIYTFHEKYTMEMNCKLGDELLIFTAVFAPGFKSNCWSIPFLFKWFLPSYDPKNGLYSFAGFLHDGLYAGGHYLETHFPWLTRDDVDDMLRGVAREAGKDRCHASAACFAVNNFAFFHWGKDEFKNFGNKFSYTTHFI